MKRKLIAILAAVTLLCSVFVGMTFSASAEGERGFGMSKSEWNDTYNQAKEYDDGIGIGADASLKSPLYGESISLSMQFSVLPANGWFVLSFAGISNFNGWQAVDPNGSGLPVTGCFYIMLQPGEETISVNIAHWKDIDGTMTKEDIAIGDVPAGLKKADAFTVDISLFGENPQIIFTQGEESYAYNKETNPQLANIARGQISDVYGRTYLNIASFEATGALKELKFTSISTLGGVEDVRNWSGAGISAVSGGVQLTGSAQYLRAVDMSSKYLKLTLDVKMIIGNVDAWIALGFGKMPALPTANQAGLNIMMRNQAGKIAMQPEINAFGGEGAVLKTTDFGLGKITIEMEEVEGKMVFSINRKVVSHATFDALTFADFTDENGCFYFSFGSFVQGDQSTNNVEVLGITTDIKAKENIYIEVSDMPESGMVGTAVTLPEAKVVQADGEEIAADITVTDPEGSDVAVTDGKFTPAVKGEYTVVYSAEDSKGNKASNTYKITVVDPDDALSMDSIKDMNNWHAPYGGVSVVDAGMQVFAHSYYKLPLSMNEGALRATFHINGLWDGNDTDEATSTDAWVAVGFVNKPAITAPGGFAADGLYVRLNNKDGKLLVSVHYFSPFGAEDIAIEDTFANESDALGDVTIEIQKKDEGVRLFVNGKEMRHENLKKVYYSDLVDANNCTYLALSAYDNDDADQKLPNVQTRCFTLTALSHEKTEVVEDTTPPVITVSGVPTEGTVGEKVILPPATVTDDLDSGLTEKISVKGPDGKSVAVVNNSFTPTEAGTYTIVYSASDSAGNKAQDQTFTIVVKAAAGGGCGSSFAAEGAVLALVCVLGAAALVLTAFRKKN